MKKIIKGVKISPPKGGEIEVQNRRMHLQLALAVCENMELPLSELKARLELNPEEYKKLVQNLH